MIGFVVDVVIVLLAFLQGIATPCCGGVSIVEFNGSVWNAGERSQCRELPLTLRMPLSRRILIVYHGPPSLLTDQLLRLK